MTRYLSDYFIRSLLLSLVLMVVINISLLVVSKMAIDSATFTKVSLPLRLMNTKSNLLVCLGVPAFLAYFNLTNTEELGRALAAGGFLHWPTSSAYSLYLSKPDPISFILSTLLHVGVPSPWINYLTAYFSYFSFFSATFLIAHWITKQRLISYLVGLVFCEINLIYLGFTFTYPALMPRSPHTNGLIGASLAYLIFAFWLNPRTRKYGYFSLPILLFIHPTFFAYIVAIIAIHWIAEKSDWNTFRKIRVLILGSVLCFVGLSIYSLLQPIYDNEILQNYLKYWDGHRNPNTVPTFKFFAVLLVVVTCTEIMRRRRLISGALCFTFHAMSLISVAVIILSYLLWMFWPTHILNLFIFSRFVNFTGLSLSAVIFLFPYLYFTSPNASADLNKGLKSLKLIFTPVPTVISLFLCTLFLVYMITSNGTPVYNLKSQLSYYQQFSKINCPPLQSGYLIAPPSIGQDLEIICRAPLKLDTRVFDYIAYWPKGISELNVSLEEIYGVSLAGMPPVMDMHTAQIRDADLKDLWSSRTSEEWMRLGCEFKIAYVAVPSDWILSGLESSIIYLSPESTVHWYKVSECSLA